MPVEGDLGHPQRVYRRAMRRQSQLPEAEGAASADRSGPFLSSVLRYAPRVRPPLARALGLFALFAGALALRLGGMTRWDRLVFDGHERHYLAAFQGHPADPSTQALPGMSAIYWLLGHLTADPRALVVFSAIAGSLGALGVALAVERRRGLVAGAWAGVLAALLGPHMAWSTSPYHVILPVSLFLWAFVAEGWLAGLLMALACSLRLELALLAPLRGRWGLTGLVGVAWWAVLAGPTPSDPRLALQTNLWLVRFLGPPVLLVAGLLSGIRWPRLLLAVVGVHLVGACFDDYGSRHALLGGLGLCALVGGAIPRLGRAGQVLGVGVALALLVDAWGLREAWHARPELEASGLPLLSTGRGGAPILPNDCMEVSEEPPIAGQALPSHYAFFTGTLGADCALWGEEDQHREWSSRGLMDRALRMRTLYRMRAVAVWRPGNGRSTRIYWRLERR